MPDRVHRVAFAASREALDLDAGWPLLRDAAEAAGLDPSVAVWEDDGVDWAAFEVVVVIYTWGYVTRRERFLTWARAVPRRTRLVNVEGVLRWNSDKTYLADLAGAGVATVPTTWVPPGTDWRPPARDYVVKPTVASGGIGAARYVTQGVAAARRHVERLHREGQTAMVQPYLSAVDEDGETALVFFGGRFSHAIAKQALLEPDAGTVFGLTAYARIDVVDGADARPRVIEVELIEPSLFLDLAPGSAGRLAEELRRLAGGDAPAAGRR